MDWSSPPRLDLHRALFVLPNLLTLGNVFCGFYAIAVCLEGSSPDIHRRAALVIFIGALLDMFDGRLARLTRTQSEFGSQLDSLADLATFGLAPAVLLYAWALAPLGLPGVWAAFVFLAGGAIRLARFNIITGEEPKTARYFTGFPIPLAAGTVVALVLSSADSGPLFGSSGVAVLAAIIAALMVSPIRFRTLKDLRITPLSASIIAFVGFCFVLASLRWSPAVALALCFLTYILYGLGEALANFARGEGADARSPRQGDSQPKAG